MRIALAGDHAGAELKNELLTRLAPLGHELIDLGGDGSDKNDDYPDFARKIAFAIRDGEADRGILICGSGIGASVAANKVACVRACLIHETFSAHQGVEDDDLNMICLGGLVVGHAAAWELVQAFLAARFSGAKRHLRRLAKVAALEGQSTKATP